jgi:hypothetical protein
MTSVTPEPTRPGTLAVPPSRRAGRAAAYVVALLLLLAVAGWVSTHPTPLETTGAVVRAQTPVAEPVYVGVFGTSSGFDRGLHLRGVHVFATSTAAVTIVPHLCHGGSVHVTTTPETFCAELGPTEDARLESGDEIVLEVVGDAPGAVHIARVRVSYRDGLQWATQDAGAPSQVDILAR